MQCPGAHVAARDEGTEVLDHGKVILEGRDIVTSHGGSPFFSLGWTKDAQGTLKKRKGSGTYLLSALRVQTDARYPSGRSWRCLARRIRELSRVPGVLGERREHEFATDRVVCAP